jgi:hypothetical protein
MNLIKRLFLAFILLCRVSGFIFSEQEAVLIESCSSPGYAVGSKEGEAVLIDLNTDGFRDSATFIPHLGLGDPSALSFEYGPSEGFYLRHQFGILKIHKRENDSLYKLDASFRKVSGLFTAYGTDCCSFEAANYPGNYIRQKDMRLYLARDDGTPQFKKDATFKLVPTFPPMLRQVAGAGHVVEQQPVWNREAPTLLQCYVRPNQYIGFRGDESRLIDFSRDSNRSDALLYVVKGLADPDNASLESSKVRRSFFRHENYLLRFQNFDDKNRLGWMQRLSSLPPSHPRIIHRSCPSNLIIIPGIIFHVPVRSLRL